MSEIYLILVVVLFALAISDLIVGVSNDAVNFLNSAIGSKAAPKWVIFGVASLGVVAGATFSSGMMEVARKGIFNPDMFVFSEIMIIFLAVMITDVILLDAFNTLGMPTSTTVSIVFELLGSAVAVSLVKMNQLGESASMLGEYINSDKALAIITGILISVVIAFTVGALIQWLTRLLFSFRYKKRFQYFGALYGGLSIAIITYFMIIKGAKGASFLTDDVVSFLKNNMLYIFLVSFVGWTIILQILNWLFKIDILKVIVLVGTFALAMAFAGNDLVNFIGVPLAGFESFKAWAASGADAEAFNMAMLAGKVKTPTYMLLIAGLIMVITLITSRKARSVVKTSIDLSRQSEGSERFGSSAISRAVVRGSVRFTEMTNKYLPASFNKAISKQFKPAPVDESIPAHERPAFDKIRAASNLMVASILISIGTSLKLPLSTTYVTFMVAMGTSLADQAWGRESAVYRISGVFAVIGGWFLTALIAFSIAFAVARLMMWGGNYTIFAMIAIALFVIIRTQISFRKKSKEEVDEDEDVVEINLNTAKVLEKCNKNTVKAIIATSKAYFLCFEGFFENDRQQLKSAIKETESFNNKAKKLKDSVYKNVQKLQQDSVDTGHFYVQVVDYLREMAHSLNFIVGPVYTHFENKHKAFTEEQVADLNEFGVELNEFFNHALHILKEEQFEKLEELIEKRAALFSKLKDLEKAQIKRIKAKEVSTRNSMLYFKIVAETKNLLLHLINVVKAQRDFILETTEQAENDE
ncbi:inorganic phosphate transporter [Roseimarinus sediminis]|uniref:inorganic phosphate transporter n=1 Tax=Roseimarinus sediminis TaxID=1610899 RepID=UPI003D1AAC28